jgi:hypothetical protein
MTMATKAFSYRPARHCLKRRPLGTNNISATQFAMKMRGYGRPSFGFRGIRFVAANSTGIFIS